MTVSISATLTHDEQVFYDLIWTPMIKLGESWLELNAPLFKVPGIEQAEELAVEDITNYAFNALILFIDVETIQIKNKVHQAAFDSASLQLKVILQEKGLGSDEYKSALSASLAAQSLATQWNK